jgi:hypothetical protein
MERPSVKVESMPRREVLLILIRDLHHQIHALSPVNSYAPDHHIGQGTPMQNAGETAEAEHLLDRPRYQLGMATQLFQIMRMTKQE